MQPFVLPTETLTLPISQKTISIRPYTVGEEKLLLMAREADPESREAQVASATEMLLRQCTHQSIDPLSLCMGEVEYLLLHLRARSVGDTINLTYKCHATAKTTEPCGHIVPIMVDLKKVEISPTPQTAGWKAGILPLDLMEGVRLEVRLPVWRDHKDLDAESTFAMFARTLVAVTRNGQREDVRDELDATKQAFIESIPAGPFNRILAQWDEALPSVRLTTPFVCTKCGYSNDIVLEGLQDFFG